jgi:alkylation response protein AidB-like acyl-CoA dehydrogenase
MARADVSIMAHHGFHTGIAMALLVYSMREGTTELDEEGRIVSTRFEDEIREIVAGDAWGSMDITEPDAGSDMAALRTRAEQDEDGNWYVTGQKMFITSGHGKYHIVIARTEEAGDGAFDGLKGLSTFLVPTYRDEPDGTRTRLATVERLEDKLGHHASATCAVRFERTPAQLIGERGDGFRQMLLLMNNARIGVGFECIGLCEAAIRTAQAYAEERRTFGKSIDRHEIIADYFDEMRTDLQGLRALAFDAAQNEEIAYRMETRGKRPGTTEVERERLQREVRRRKKAARRVTPLLKYLGAEKAVEMARRCVQIHGGVGYTTEYGAEKLLRDAMVMPIYEGTSQIQSLMAMKDTLGRIMKNPQDFVARIAQARWRSISSRDPHTRQLARVQSASLAAQQHLITKTVGDKFKTVRNRPIAEWVDGMSRNWDPKRDFAHAMLHAENLTRILADEAICEILLEQAREHPERMPVFERYIERAEPRCRYLLDVITSTGDRLLEDLHPLEASQASAAE